MRSARLAAEMHAAENHPAGFSDACTYTKRALRNSRWPDQLSSCRQRLSSWSEQEEGVRSASRLEIRLRERRARSLLLFWPR